MQEDEEKKLFLHSSTSALTSKKKKKRRGEGKMNAQPGHDYVDSVCLDYLERRGSAEGRVKEGRSTKGNPQTKLRRERRGECVSVSVKEMSSEVGSGPLTLSRWFT